MSNANLMSAFLVPIVVALAVRYAYVSRRRTHSPDPQTSRVWAAWEVRGLVFAVMGPCAAGIAFGYVSVEYVLTLVLFVAAGSLAAALLSPANQHVHR